MIFWYVSPFTLLDIYKHSAGNRCIHLQSTTGNSRIVSNLGTRLPDYTVLYPTRHHSIIWPTWGPQTYDRREDHKHMTDVRTTNLTRNILVSNLQKTAADGRKCSEHSRSGDEMVLKLRFSETKWSLSLLLFTQVRSWTHELMIKCVLDGNSCKLQTWRGMRGHGGALFNDTYPDRTTRCTYVIRTNKMHIFYINVLS
jgi:hypothetical protein